MMTRNDALRRAQRVDALGTMRSASMSRPESVSSRMQKDGCSSAICRISMRFFSPPEKPTLRARLSMSFGMSSWLAAALTRLMKSGVVSSASPRALRCALSAALRKVIVATPGISSGYWKARNRPARGALVGLHLEQVLAVEQDLAVEDLVVRLAGDARRTGSTCPSRSAP